MKTVGLSLFELLVVLLLVSIIITFALPLSNQWYQNQLAFIMQKDIEQAVEHGIQKSIILGEPLRLMPLQRHNWGSGMVLVRERETSHVLYTWLWRKHAFQILWHGFVSNVYLRFVPELDQSAMNGYFLIENADHHGVKIVINRVGRMREMRY
jgi:Tfp pilus assembly protein FimT